MSDEVELPTTFPMTLAGREIMFKRPALGQVLILQRMYYRKVKDAEQDERDEGKGLTEVIIKTLDFIDTLVVDPDNRQFIEDQMLAGEIDWKDLIKSLSGGQKESVPDDEAPKPVKRASRKSPKAAPVAKTVASRGRAKR